MTLPLVVVVGADVLEPVTGRDTFRVERNRHLYGLLEDHAQRAEPVRLSGRGDVGHPRIHVRHLRGSQRPDGDTHVFVDGPLRDVEPQPVERQGRLLPGARDNAEGRARVGHRLVPVPVVADHLRRTVQALAYGDVPGHTRAARVPRLDCDRAVGGLSFGKVEREHAVGAQGP